MIEKILERLEAEVTVHRMERMEERVGKKQTVGFGFGIRCAYGIVQEVAKDCGWVSVEDRLPKKQDEYLVWWTADSFKGKCFYEIIEYHLEDGWIGEIPQAPFGKYTVIAWQPLPAPYQKGE